jgi:hypothetical protein
MALLFIVWEVVVVGDGVVGDGQACNGRTADAVSSEAFLGSVWVCGVLVVALREFVSELFGFIIGLIWV